MKEINKTIRLLISQDKLAEALSLIKASHDNIINEGSLITIEGSLKNLERQISLNLINVEQANIERNRIRVAILELNNSSNEIHPALKKRKYFIFSLFLVVLFSFSGLWYFFFYLPSSNELFTTKGTYNVLLSKFNAYSEKKDFNLEGAIFDRLQTISAVNNLFIDTKIDKSYNPKEAPLGYRDAEKVGISLKANLMIWGNYEIPPSKDSLLIINIKYLTTGELGETIYTSSKKGQTGMKTINTISTLAQGELTGDIEDIVYWALGIVSFLDEEYVEARRFFSMIKPKNEIQQDIVFQAIAETYIKTKEYLKAKNLLNSAIKINPLSITALSNRAAINMLLEDYQASIDDIQLIRILKVKDSVIRSNVSIVEAEIELKNLLSSSNKHQQMIETILAQKAKNNISNNVKNLEYYAKTKLQEEVNEDDFTNLEKGVKEENNEPLKKEEKNTDKLKKKKREKLKIIPSKRRKKLIYSKNIKGNIYNGFVINLKGDTIKGKVKFINPVENATKVKFIYSSGEEKTFKNKDIVEYAFVYPNKSTKNKPQEWIHFISKDVQVLKTNGHKEQEAPKKENLKKSKKLFLQRLIYNNHSKSITLYNFYQNSSFIGRNNQYLHSFFIEDNNLFSFTFSIPVTKQNFNKVTEVLQEDETIIRILDDFDYNFSFTRFPYIIIDYNTVKKQEKY